MHKKKRGEDRRDTDGHEPFIADVAWWMKRESLCRELIVKLLDQRFERRPLNPQAERGNSTLEELLVRE